MAKTNGAAISRAGEHRHPNAGHTRRATPQTTESPRKASEDYGHPRRYREESTEVAAARTAGRATAVPPAKLVNRSDPRARARSNANLALARAHHADEPETQARATQAIATVGVTKAQSHAATTLAHTHARDRETPLDRAQSRTRSQNCALRATALMRNCRKRRSRQNSKRF